jgi:chemotaxis signal transduction protein
MSSRRILEFSDSLSDAPRPAPALPAEWATVVTFYLGAELFGFAVNAIQEVIRVGQIVRVPHAPYTVRGIHNLRGRVVPIVDLRVRLGLARVEVTERSRLLITPAHNRMLGLLVDSVDQVTRIDLSRMTAPPADVLSEHSEYITGVYQQDPQFLIMLDIERVLLVPDGLEEHDTNPNLL